MKIKIDHVHSFHHIIGEKFIFLQQKTDIMHRFFPILTTFLTFCFIAILAMPVHASSHENAPVMETIVVSTPPTGWPPFIIPPKNKENDTGIMMEIMDTITNRIGYHMNTVHFPEKRSQMLLAEGRVDAYAKAKEWVKNPSLYSWTDPIVTTTDVLVFLKKSPIQFQTPKDLSGLNIGIVYGFSYPTLDPLFDKAIIKCHTSKCTKNLLLMVQRGHIHAAATNRHVAEWIIKTTVNYPQRISHTAPPPSVLPPIDSPFQKIAIGLLSSRVSTVNWRQ